MSLMRRRQVVLLLLSGLLAGCAGGPPERRPSAWLPRWRAASAAASSRLVQMEVALIERPVGDGYLNGRLWDLANEQVVPFDRKGAVAGNGFRVGMISGLPPAELQALLTSERSCANPRRIQRTAGDAATLLLGQTIPECRFQLVQDGRGEAVALANAQCTLLVVPTPAAEGRTRLQFTPQVRHGDAALVPRPAVDRAGTYSWMLQEHRPTESYPQLSWEVTLAPNEYVVVGGRLDRPQTLGHSFFIRGDEPNPVQRLLVIRTARLQPVFETEGDGPDRQAPPLALQAALSGREKR
jgi:hypothetical protein